MRIIEMIHGNTCMVDDNDYERLSRHRWHLATSGYVVRFQGRKCLAMHREILGAVSGTEVDHVDRGKTNNQKVNLRLCSKTQNQGNRLGSRKSGFKGVRWHKRDEVWEAYITKHGKMKYLGYFNNQNDAALAYNAAAKEHFGEFALLNPV